MKTRKIRGIVLRGLSIFEKDKLIEILSPEEGKIKLLAKHAHTSRFRFGGGIEPLTYAQFVVHSGKTFHYINQCDIIRTFHGVRHTFNSISLAFYCADIIRQATIFYQHNAPLFDLLLTALSLIERREMPLADIRHFFQNRFLAIEGLIAENEVITTQRFKMIFEEYSGRALKTLVQIDDQIDK